MEIEHIGQFITGLKSHSGMAVNFKEDKVRKALEKIQMRDSSRFYEIIINDRQTINEEFDDRYHYFYTSRVLRNKNASDYELSTGKKLIMDLPGMVGLKVRSSTHASRRLRLNPEIVSVLTNAYENGHDFSLLGRLDTYDISRPEAIYKKRRPFLIVPGEVNNPVILDWEDADTKYEREPCRTFLFGGKSKPISKEDYLAALNSV